MDDQRAPGPDVVDAPADRDLGPFSPPHDFDHGQEFEPSVPRPIPGRLRRGLYGRKQWAAVVTLAVLATGCIFMAPWQITQDIALTILPLAYLDWIGYALFAIAVLVAVKNCTSMERYGYVRDGVPIAGRVLEARPTVVQSINPQTKAVIERTHYLVNVEYDDPQSRKHETASVLSDENWNAKQDSQYAISIEPGDYVTLVALPDKIPSTIRLYGFLGLDPEREYITRNGQRIQGTSPLTAAVISLLVIGGIWMLICGLHVVLSCMPEEWSWPIGLSFLGAGLVLGNIGSWLLFRHEHRKNSGAPFPRIGAIFVGTLFGLFGGAIVMGLINAAFDHSPATYRPVEIVNHWQVTHNLVIRTYEVEYREFGNPKSEKHTARAQDLMNLGSAELGALEVHRGGLGLSWIRGIHPFYWIPLPDPVPEKAAKYAVTFENAGPEGGSASFFPALILNGQDATPAPPDLVEKAKQQMPPIFNEEIVEEPAEQ